MKAREIFDWLDHRAPFETQLDYDNSGWIVGDPEMQVSGIHLALDCTPQVLQQMLKNGSNLLITHHPLMFTPIHSILDSDYEGGLIAEMLRNQMTMIASHTCLDQAEGGINDALAHSIGLTEIRGTGFVRVGRLPKAMDAESFAGHLETVLQDRVRIMGSRKQAVSHVGLCSGAGGSEWQEAREMGASAFVTGEMKHHLSLEANASGIVCFECGHAATELPGIRALREALQSADFIVKSDLRVTMS